MSILSTVTYEKAFCKLQNHANELQLLFLRSKSSGGRKRKMDELEKKKRRKLSQAS